MRDAFLEGMSRAAATVSVITTDGPAGRAGLTVSAMASVSADTPTPALLVCVHHRSTAAEAIQTNGVFCVNVLRSDQVAIADTFAGRIRTPSGDKFDCARWRTLETGAPVLETPLVAFDCRLMMHFRYGTHWIFIGELEAVALPDGGPPLVYANRTYNRPVALAATRVTPREGEETLTIGCLSTLAPAILPGLLSGFLEARPELGVELVEGDQDELVEALASGRADVALTYDIALGDDIAREALSTARPFVLLPGDDPRAGAPVSLAALAAEPLVLVDLPRTRDYLLSLFARLGLTPRIAWRAASAEMAASLVAHGFGYAVLLTEPKSGTSHDGRPVAAVPIAEALPEMRLVAATSRGAVAHGPAQAFVAHCRAQLQAVA